MLGHSLIQLMQMKFQIITMSLKNQWVRIIHLLISFTFHSNNYLFRSQANRTESFKPRLQLLCGLYQRYDEDF